MVNVTYNIPETGPLVLYAVRDLSLRLICATDKSSDYFAIFFEAQRLTYSFSISFLPSLDFPEEY
jgi:hypothetical protein